MFVNYESFFEHILTTAGSESDESWFFSGYDCDSLAFEGVSGFVSDTLDFLGNAVNGSGRPQPMIELRTKSASVEPLLRRSAIESVVVAYSLSPAAVAQEVEHRAPTLERRIDALRRLQESGWQVGLRFDPLLYRPGFRDSYCELFEQVFGALDVDAIHSVSLGVFRLPKDFHRRLVRLYPLEPLLAMPMAERNGMVSYTQSLESELFEGCREDLMEWIREEQYFPCLS